MSRLTKATRHSHYCTDSFRWCTQRVEFTADLLGGFGPNERLGLPIVVLNVSPDGVLQFSNRPEDAATDAPSGDGGEEAFDRVEPGCRCRGEVEHPARMIGQPPLDLGVLVGGVIVEDGVNDLADRHGALDRIEECDEFLMAVLVHASAEHGAVQHIERGEQSRNAV